MIADFYSLLLDSTLALSAALLAVVFLRRPLRQLSGARVAYALWSVVPLAMVAALLPEPASPAQLPMLPALTAALDVMPNSAGADSPTWRLLLLTVWGAGAAVLLLASVASQRRFRKTLGRLRPRPDGCLQSDSAEIGPAVIGVWRGRIVVPADFEQRYSTQEQELVLGHERVHLARHDLLFNLAALAIRCLNWFNPLVHYAVRCFRFDQELAADAMVLARRPAARRAYADAMLKTQLTGFGSPLGCHWQSAHPLKERIVMLKRPLPGLARFAVGLVVAGSISISIGYAAWAVQPAASQTAVNLPSYARIKPPKYPQEAIAAGAEGTVLLRVLVGADGVPQKVEVDESAGNAGLDDAARTTVLDWRFNAGTDGENPVPTWVHVPITFEMDPDAPIEPVKFADKQALDAIWIRNR